MAFKVDLNPAVMRCAAGEPIVFSYQPANALGIPESVAGKAYTWAIYNANRQSVKSFPGIVSVDERLVYWAFDGRLSEELYAQSGLKWEISERLDNSRDRILNGTLMIEESAPVIDDYDAAPIAKYIFRIKRSNDPADLRTNPNFSLDMASFVPPVTNGASDGPELTMLGVASGSMFL